MNCPENITRRSIALYYYTHPKNITYLTEETKWKSKLDNSTNTTKAINKLKSLWKQNKK